MSDPDKHSARKVIVIRCVVVAGIVGVLGMAAVLSIGFLENARIERHLAAAQEALQQGDPASAQEHVRQVLDLEPDHPEALIVLARATALTGEPDAASSWQCAIDTNPHKPELRVGQVLALLQVGSIIEAGEALTKWPQDERNTAAWHRAAVAVSFASGDDEAATIHAEAAARLEPDSMPNQINLAKARLLAATDTATVASAVATLFAIAERPGHRFEALHALARHAIRSSDRELLESVREHSANDSGDAALRFLALEIAGRLDEPISRDELAQVWQSMARSPVQLAALIGWMVETGRAQTALDLWTSDPGASGWTFPVGFALAEAAISAGEHAVALENLKRIDWGQQDALRLLCLARITVGEPLSGNLLARAVDQTGGNAPGLRTLRQTAETWGWTLAERDILMALTKRDHASILEIRRLMQLIEAAGDIEALTQTSMLIARQHPDVAVFQNNAAYLMAQQDEDLELALSLARRAVDLDPANPEFRKTLDYVRERGAP